jgi:radical SAM protein
VDVATDAADGLEAGELLDLSRPMSSITDRSSAGGRGALLRAYPDSEPSTDTEASGVDFDRRPILVFWEATRACLLACRHCRASAISQPLPGELSTVEAELLLDRIAGFGNPRPVLVATGGDVLMRADLDRLAARAGELKVPLALAPSVTRLLDQERVASLRRLGVKVASISLDGATAAVHDHIRGVPGHFEATLAALRLLRRGRITVQVNTVVMVDTVDELPAIARIVKESGASIWELFFLVHVGRGATLGALSAAENEHVCHFLVDASCHGVIVRTVEAPFFRRIVAERADGADPPADGLYRHLRERLGDELGPAQGPPRAQTKGTRDGRGILFVGHDGTITPSGFLPLPLGNVRDDDLVRVYREHPLLRRIRAADFSGRCRLCRYRELCGGSRARAYAATGNPLAEDPGCAYQPTPKTLRHSPAAG